MGSRLHNPYRFVLNMLKGSVSDVLKLIADLPWDAHMELTLKSLPNGAIVEIEFQTLHEDGYESPTLDFLLALTRAQNDQPLDGDHFWYIAGLFTHEPDDETVYVLGTPKWEVVA
jgi:hypothetical protein